MGMPDNLSGVLGAPKGPAYYVQRLLQIRQITPNQASKLIGVNQSTLSRFLAGSALTEEMAAKLKVGLGVDIDMLFAMEAQRKAYNSKQLLAS